MDDRVDRFVAHELGQHSGGAGCGEVELELELEVGHTGNAVPQPTHEIVNDEGSVAALDEEAADVSADVAGVPGDQYAHAVSLRDSGQK
jgi:hypothetical protein